MNSRIVAILGLAALASRGLVASDNLPEPEATKAVVSLPPAQFAPLTSSERFRNYLVGWVDAESILRAGAGAAIMQADGTPKEWRGGAEGYGKRIGSAYAEHTIDRTLEYGISAVLHEDNRYFVSGETGFLRRTKYAIKSTFLARHDNGRQYFSFSRIGGAAGAGFISRAWQPRSTTSAGDGAESFGIIMAADVGFNVFREFWPDMKRRFRKH